MNSWRILHGDVRERLADLQAGSVRCCVTSPPYWGLRDYGVDGQLGLEQTPEAYVQSMVAVFREVRRVLSDDGTLWLNLGDSYAGGGHTGRRDCGRDMGGGRGGNYRNGVSAPVEQIARSVPDNLKAKDLVGIPWMVAFALRADGWYLRSDIIWSKPNPMPESVTDRPTKAHEYIFLLSKSKNYYYDADAIREPHESLEATQKRSNFDNKGTKHVRQSDLGRNRLEYFADGGRNKRSVWHVTPQPYPEAHFVTYPESLIEPCILAGSAFGDTVLDPFTGSGTTGAVAIRHQRNFIGCELNPANIKLARKRIGNVAPMFAQEVA